MPEFSLHARYCTPTGRTATRDALRQAVDMDAALRAFTEELAQRGNRKIDIQAWPANTWKELNHA